jgi:hypothetical protein
MDGLGISGYSPVVSFKEAVTKQVAFWSLISCRMEGSFQAAAFFMGAGGQLEKKYVGKLERYIVPTDLREAIGMINHNPTLLEEIRGIYHSGRYEKLFKLG